MPFKEVGEAVPGLFVLGRPQTPIYLYDSGVPVFFDGGMSFLADAYISQARAILKGGHPGMLLTTHMHFDHCGATAAIRDAFPGLKIGASSLGAEIMGKPKARELIRQLNDEAGKLFGGAIGGDLPGFNPFNVDFTLKEGDELEIGNETIKVYETPGHTRDYLSYYIPSRKILLASEAAGCAHHSGQVMVEFASDYESYLATIDKLAALDAQVLCQGHHFVFTGAEVKEFLDESRRLTLLYRKRAEELLDEHHGDIDAVVQRLKVEEWEPLPWPKQPEAPYLLNTYGRIRSLAALKAGADPAAQWS